MLFFIPKFYRISQSCLLSCNINTIPIPLNKICKHYNIKIIAASTLSTKYLSDNELGACFITQKQKYIVVQDTISKPLQRFTVAHEIGHILLNHLPNTFITREQEIEAELFALCLLMPPYIIQNLNDINIIELCNFCQCPHTMLQKYIEIYKYLF